MKLPTWARTDRACAVRTDCGCIFSMRIAIRCGAAADFAGNAATAQGKNR